MYQAAPLHRSHRKGLPAGAWHLLLVVRNLDTQVLYLLPVVRNLDTQVLLVAAAAVVVVAVVASSHP